ncbi:imelysin [Nonlabens xylanidelens]|uniref:Imelysin n=1 Tax=Nonlabens xylanidelens TaxID=191564 RepID=A0A2S6ILN6_9FLAO|nr:imelysin family protein [Nonlabens xylanidelens]PPK95147.1 imelysin [Nonlabens xylanidelens]PQJ17673.1 peptidase M75 superfamily protein [Nonlabens xylanidelens]
MKLRNLVLVLFAAIAIGSCSESEDDGVTTTDSFDRKALLENAADNIIIPALQDLSDDLNSLKTSKDLFIATPNQANLDELREKWLDAYMTWQYVEMFNIGRAEEILYSFQMNVYPTNVTDIQNNIASASYDLTSPNNNDAVGFPAVDYLLYGTANNDVDILNYYSTDFSAASHQQYLSDVIDQMDALTTTVLSDWTGSYRDTFVNSTGNTVTSSVNLLINDFIFYYEKGLRANKVGIPAGVFSTTPLADRVEGLYSKEFSKELALEGLQAVDDFFNGRAYNGTTTGLSYASYVTELRTNNGTSDLTTAINNQLAAARAQMNVLDDNFANQVNTDNTLMTRTYDELQVATVLFKIDMLQTLNISVDFVDADGD